MKASIVKLDAERREEVAQLFHRIWHETQAQLQDPRMARYRDIDFFRKRVSEWAERTIVALADKCCVGFAAWTGGRLNSLFVDQQFRGRGAGAVLCSEAERQMSMTGARQFDLDCIEGNFAARRLYERQGWRVEVLITLENEIPEGLCKVGAWKMVKP